MIFVYYWWLRGSYQPQRSLFVVFFPTLLDFQLVIEATIFLSSKYDLDHSERMLCAVGESKNANVERVTIAAAVGHRCWYAHTDR